MIILHPAAAKAWHSSWLAELIACSTAAWPLFAIDVVQASKQVVRTSIVMQSASTLQVRWASTAAFTLSRAGVACCPHSVTVGVLASPPEGEQAMTVSVTMRAIGKLERMRSQRTSLRPLRSEMSTLSDQVGDNACSGAMAHRKLVETPLDPIR